jgi:acyl CoA:acetate/3-ketoacid CoA transferase
VLDVAGLDIKIAPDMRLMDARIFRDAPMFSS